MRAAREQHGRDTVRRTTQSRANLRAKAKHAAPIASPKTGTTKPASRTTGTSPHQDQPQFSVGTNRLGVPTQRHAKADALLQQEVTGRRTLCTREERGWSFIIARANTALARIAAKEAARTPRAEGTAVRTALRPRRRARSAEHRTETGNLADRVLAALTAHEPHDTTPDRERVGVAINLNDTIRQLVVENLRQKYALLGNTLIETLTAQEAAAHAHKKAVFTAYIAAANSSHAAATARRGKRRIPMPANQPRITAWMHPPAGKRAREEDDAGGHDLAETELLSDWLQQKRNGSRETKRWRE